MLPLTPRSIKTVSALFSPNHLAERTAPLL